MSAAKDKNPKSELTRSTVSKLAERIKAVRISRGYDSYESFANDHNLHRAQVGRYEKGTDLQFSSLVKLVRAFDMTLLEFFSEGFEDIDAPVIQKRNKK